MKKNYTVIGIVLLVLANAIPARAQKAPNIIFILTDDLGYGDIGAFFQNQRQKSGDRSKPYELTPNIDQLAVRGAK